MASGSPPLTAATAWLAAAFTENLTLKLASLAFSIGMFVYLHGQEDQQLRTVPVGVVLRMPVGAQKRELMTQMPANLHLTLRGSARAIDQFTRGGIAPVELDLTDGQKDAISFSAADFSLPPGLEVTTIDPPMVELDWQDIVTRQLPIQASITGTPAEGFQVKGEPHVEPTEISITGPRSQVEVLQFARLAAFDVSGLSEGRYPRRIAIDAPPPRAAYVGPQAATVTVTVARRVTEVRFAKRPVEIIGVTGGFTSPRFVDVTVIGAPEVVRALRADQVVPRADVSALPGLDLRAAPHGSTTVKVTVDLAQAEAECQPPTVKVQW